MKTNEKWTGCTVQVREYNGYDDSDFFATYWNGESFVEDLCGTTRFAFPCLADVDAAPEIIELWRAEQAIRRAAAAAIAAEKEAANPTTGKRVRVLEGRKYKGMEGVIFWRGANKFRTYYRNGYNDPDALHNQNIGVKTDDGQKIFVPATYVVVI